MGGKTCKKCGELKPLDSFYACINNKDNLMGKCKNCVVEYQRARRYGPARDRVLSKQKEHYFKNRSHYSADRLARRKLTPLKARARAAVNNAIHTGRLLKQPCEDCGLTKVHAHHEDYAKPLDVRWLCKDHHLNKHFPERALYVR